MSDKQKMDQIDTKIRAQLYKSRSVAAFRKVKKFSGSKIDGFHSTVHTKSMDACRLILFET